MNKYYELYINVKEETKYYKYANFVINFDNNTICPEKGKPFSYEVRNYFHNKTLNLMQSAEYIEAIKYLNENSDSLNAIEKKEVNKIYKDIIKKEMIDLDKQKAANKLASENNLLWEKARKTVDFGDFEKNVEKYVDYLRYYCNTVKKDEQKPYDVILNEYEEGLNVETYDKFFNLLEKECLDLVKEILTKEKLYNPKLDNLEFEIDKQKELTKYICEIMGYTSDIGYIGETIHPFSISAHSNDVRTTTNYHLNSLFSNVFSVMHEIGHALYNHQHDESLNNTKLYGGTSSGIHESQSRFYENYLGRSKEFIEFLYPKLVELFPKQFDGISSDDVYYYVNSVSRGLKRIEADELTYPFHVMIRYQVEKALINNEITVYQMGDKFDEYMEKYLGIKPENKLEGCFQDIHWTSMYGYFPTYALGSAYSAMFYDEIIKDIDVKNDMANGNFQNINLWLKEKIHTHGGLKSNSEVINFVCNKDFDPSHYVNYLKNKFKEIYNIK